MCPDVSNVMDLAIPNTIERRYSIAKKNNKLFPPRLATKKDKPCLHVFKYINYKENHQVNSNTCPYW